MTEARIAQTGQVQRIVFNESGNSSVYDGVFWLEQVRTADPVAVFDPARATDSPELPLP